MNFQAFYRSGRRRLSAYPISTLSHADRLENASRSLAVTGRKESPASRFPYDISLAFADCRNLWLRPVSYVPYETHDALLTRKNACRGNPRQALRLLGWEKEWSFTAVASFLPSFSFHAKQIHVQGTGIPQGVRMKSSTTWQWSFWYSWSSFSFLPGSGLFLYTV